ncbi:MAG: molybdopterin-binding protein [Nitrosomonadales bacterium]|nr:molybdopterin-binding protein [Nitrosomonadales bacterium]
MNSHPNFGIIIIGDEILSGKRQDAHLAQAIGILKTRGLSLSWAEYLGDEPERITALLQRTMATPDIVFCFGGIGATPDDCTRQSAAAAAALPIERHAGAIAEIEAQFGEAAYPKRVLMADFPQGAGLIPNPVNRVPGFSLGSHYFMPGFPQMAHPMMEWVLDTHYRDLFHLNDYKEQSVTVIDGAESQLIDLMNRILEKYPDVKLFSLPRLGPQKSIELGLKGPAQSVETAMPELCAGLTDAGLSWSEVTESNS